MRNAQARSIATALVLASAAAVAGCRKGTQNDTTGFGFEVGPIVPSALGAGGCNGPNHAFAGPFPIAPVAVWTDAAVAPTSRVAAALDAPELYVTLAAGALVELDFSGGDPPVATELLPADFVRDQVLAPSGIAGDAVVSGVAVTTANNLVLMEHTGNVLISAFRNPPAFATALGTPTELGGFLDGTLFAARFRFDAPGDLCPTGDGRILVTDTGNNVLRQIETTPLGLFVTTVAGTGQTESSDGDILETAFDTPYGLKVDCENQMIVTERGDFGGGNRLRAVAIGTDAFFGSIAVDSQTLAGDGVALTLAGVDGESSLAMPSAPVVTAGGEVYWVDSLTGVLRRYAFATGLADCPLDVDCAAAVASTPFTPGGAFALALDGAGALYVLDCAAQTLYRIP
jgi:hypothetical protein